MQEFEYVSRKEYSPVKQELEMIIRRVQKIMREEYETEVRFQLIGSSNRYRKRSLITRIIGGNKGYDLDYNLIVPTLEDGYHYRPKVLADQFMNAFRKAVKGTSFSTPEDRSSVIRIRRRDPENKRVLYGGDFAIICYEEDENDGYKYLKHWDDGHYTFEMRGHSRNVNWKLEYIDGYKNGWNWIRDEYLKLKNRNNDLGKHSFELYLEAVHNVYNHIIQTEENEE